MQADNAIGSDSVSISFERISHKSAARCYIWSRNVWNIRLLAVINPHKIPPNATGRQPACRMAVSELVMPTAVIATVVPK